jgi:hypothetical protein
MTLGRKQDTKVDTTLGPGHYNIRDLESKHAVNFGKQVGRASDDQMYSPGPGSYDDNR